MARFLAVSDLHYPYPPLSAPEDFLIRVLRLAKNNRVDAIIAAGDVLAYGNVDIAMKFSKIVKKYFGRPIYTVLGNHEHYLSRNMLKKKINSIEQIKRIIKIFRENDIHVLDSHGPIKHDNTWIAGTAGWYDYTWGPQKYTVKDYEQCNPYGIPITILEHCDRKNLWGNDPYCPAGTRLDCIYIRLPYSHPEYHKQKLIELEKQLQRTQWPTIVVTHHPGLKTLLPEPKNELEKFNQAYNGSDKIFITIKKYIDKIHTYLYGHLHEKSKYKILTYKNIKIINSYFPTIIEI